nr:hypothetical protein [uncultured Campylobacter sp.]
MLQRKTFHEIGQSLIDRNRRTDKVGTGFEILKQKARKFINLLRILWLNLRREDPHPCGARQINSVANGLMDG